jgi:formylglycine-generating enzyme required for sulfatase activity
LSEAEWRAALKPLLVAIDTRSGEFAGGVAVGDVSVVVGRDLVIQIPQPPAAGDLQPHHLPAQLAALRQALPGLDPTGKAAAQAAIERLEQSIAALPEHERRFRERIKERFAEQAGCFVELMGETTSTTSTTSLDPNALNSANLARFLSQGDLAEYHEWIPFEKEIRRAKLKTLREGVDKHPCLILLGDPGSGKTTALENLAYQFAGEPDKLPLLLYLNEFMPEMSLEEFIVQGWAGSREANYWGAPELAANLEGYLADGRLFLLFDALNEMPREKYHDHVHALRRFIDRWAARGNRFVVTCRVLDYGDDLTGLQRVEVQPFNDDQIQALLRKILPPDKWESLWQILTGTQDKQRRLLEMARNPFMLNMMIYVFAVDSKLSQNRAGLMSCFTRLLLERTRFKFPRGEWLDADVQHEALSALAFEIQARSGFGTLVKTEHLKAVMPHQVQLDPKWPPIPSPPDRVLALAAAGNIITMPADRSSVRFYHQLLQEYFAACEMRKRAPGTLADYWRWPWLETEMPPWARPAGNYDPLPPPPQTGWEETTILAAGLAPERDDQLVRALASVNPVLAGRCLSEGQAKVDRSVRQAVVDALRDALARPEVALRVRIAAGEVLGYLGAPGPDESVVVPAGSTLMGEGHERHRLFLPAYRFGKYPVTNSEYARFIEAGGYRDRRWWTEAGWAKIGQQQGQPWLWSDARFNKPSQPVVGVSWYECVAYCRWLSAEAGRPYRLPTEAEWEKGARGTNGQQYPWGHQFEAGRLNASEGEQVVNGITPVGIYPTGVSPNGAFDCAGNVWEWCATKAANSRLKPYPYAVTEDEWTDDYLEGADMRALRGGAWDYNRNYARCAYRHWYYPCYLGYHYWGFRLVSPL